MAFVKLDCGILNSTLWFRREAREIFITALLMAEPFELREPAKQIETRTLEYTDFEVPPGWYGFVPAAGIGIIQRAQIPEQAGFEALEELSSPDKSSRSPEYDGRRLVRINGGYLILNYQKYRDRDYTTADRSRRYRERKLALATASRRDITMSHRDITQEEVEADTEAYITTPGLNLEVWKRWVAYRKDLKKPIRPVSQEAAQKKLAAFGDLQAEVVEQSIANGWQGLFALNGAKNGTDNSAPGRVRAANGIKR